MSNPQLSINRRAFVASAGFAFPAVSTTVGAEAPNSPAERIPTGKATDATNAINDRLRNDSEVRLGPGEYRIDGTIIVPKHTRLALSHGATLKRYADESDSTAPVVRVLGNRACLGGGRIVTENNHPQGIVTLGHSDASRQTQYTATQWKFSDCWIEGRQAPGNVGIWIPNSQATFKTIDFANYYGFVQNVAVRGSDIGVLLDEVANGHRFFGVFFSHLMTAAWELRGAYANQVFGGFLHGSKNGIVAIRLRNTTNDKYHDSVYNSFFGFGIEPGGAKSSAYHIESRCFRNTLFLQSNAAARSVDENGQNLISRHGGIAPDGPAST